MFPNIIDKSTGANTIATNAATFIAASMSKAGEIVAFKTRAPTAMAQPAVFAANESGFPFNSIAFICMPLPRRQKRPARRQGEIHPPGPRVAAVERIN
jgi:hypothetical protein